MELIALIISVLSFVLLAVILFLINAKKSEIDTSKLELLFKNEFKENRLEILNSLKENRTELSDGLSKLTERLEEKLKVITDDLNKNSKINRDELNKSLKSFDDTFKQSVKEFNDLQKQKFDVMAVKQDELVKSTELKLEKMRETVDEKLHKTLEHRLGQSFKIVSERLEAVQKGLGEMQNLANGVGDLKKVLSNVKTRGVLGEIQLGNILEQIMSPEQYDANVKTKLGSNDHVEFAIKLPGKDDNGTQVYLPIDAKFPQEDYVRLQTAYDEGDIVNIEKSNRALVQSVKKFAREIRDKYIEAPYTTDFGIMFLPIEGLYAEIVRQPDVVAFLQREYKIIVTGPTTLSAFLNSLHMGFKTVAIEKRSSEVWQILSAVKKQFGEFGKVLKSAQTKIRQADSDIEKLVTTRTNMMFAKLKNVDELPATETKRLE